MQGQNQNPSTVNEPLANDIPTTILQRFFKDQQSKVKIQEKHIFLKVMLGKCFIQGFRPFKVLPDIDSFIFFKRENSKTHYKFLLVEKSLSEYEKSPDVKFNQQQTRVNVMKANVERMIRRELVEFSVSLAFVKQMVKVILTNQQKKEDKKKTQIEKDPSKNPQKKQPTYQLIYNMYMNLNNPLHKLQLLKLAIFSVQQNAESSSKMIEEPTNAISDVLAKTVVDSFIPKLTKEDRDILFESQKQLDELKAMISIYVDTFGNKNKAKYIYKQMERSSVSFSVDMLLNTICYIVYEETRGTVYSQIESKYWTYYDIKLQKLVSDRKHIVLSGSGQLCVLEFIFMKEIESENQIEYLSMQDEFKKFYKKAKIKMVRILNQKWNGNSENISLLDQDEKHITIIDEEDNLIPHDHQEKKTEQNNHQIIYKFTTTLSSQYVFSKKR